MRPDSHFLAQAGRICGWGALAFFLCTSGPLADNWRAKIYETAAPRNLVGVDKKHKLFNFFEKKSPFKLRYSYPCVTGQLHGDKQQINDLRTPEGIYFVEYKIANGLDFREYGGIAYTLNYPNPVDRLRGKTGHGIWIHSKGFGLTPTRGCVAINLNDIAEVGPSLVPGTPVILAEELENPKKADNGSLDKLKELMGDWTDAWAQRSHKLFDFYDPGSYTKATENFDHFKKNKERLFKILSFINIYNREIHALEGPGYWVTWSEQLYRASNLSTEGIRRLYWQKDANNDFKIVGMEWTPRDLGMEAAFRQGELVAQAPQSTLTDASSEAPKAPRLDMPEQDPGHASRIVTSPAVTDKTPSFTSVAQNPRSLNEPLLPGPVKVPAIPNEINWGQGRPLQNPPDSPKPEPGSLQKPTPALQLPAAPKPASVRDNTALTEDIRKQIDDLAQTWREYLQDRNAAIEQMYDPKSYNRLPAALGVPRGASLNSALQTIRRDYKQPWLIILSRPSTISGTASAPCSAMDMMLISPLGIRQGIQQLWWHKDSGGQYKIVGSNFKPANLGLEAAYLEQISGPIANVIEEWRKAWENGDLDRYSSFYAANANQQGHIGAAAIKRQKQNLWSRVKPVEVNLAGLRIHLDGAGVRADMTQTYVNSAGHSDKGIKTLELRFDGEKWIIQRENWTGLPQSASS